MALIAAATQECFAGAVALAPFCSLQQILLDNPEAKSILESRFGPLQDKDHRAADAIRLTARMSKPVLLIHGTKDETVPIAHDSGLRRMSETSCASFLSKAAIIICVTSNVNPSSQKSPIG